MGPNETLRLEQVRLETMRERLARNAFVTVEEVAACWCVARSTVDQLPREVLPFIDLAPRAGRAARRLKRFHPSDVEAARAIIPAWREAQRMNREFEFLNEMRSEIQARDEALRKRARAAWDVVRLPEVA